jgi:hypothetical protein
MRIAELALQPSDLGETAMHHLIIDAAAREIIDAAAGEGLV